MSDSMGNNRNKILSIWGIILLASCSNLGKEVENKYDELKNKSSSLDSLMKKEVDKVLSLDSLLTKETERVKKIDTLINQSASQLDSIKAKGTRLVEKVTR